MECLKSSQTNKFMLAVIAKNKYTKYLKKAKVYNCKKKKQHCDYNKQDENNVQ